MKILNIDKLAEAKRQLVIFGETHDVRGMDVANFIESTVAAERLTGETSLAKQVEATIEMVCRAVPTISTETLRSLTLEQLQAVVAYVRGDEVDGVESSEEGAGEKK
jgi:hypothetical protein